MGYRRVPKVYRLVFTEDEFAGLEVRARSVPLGQFLELTALADMDPSKLSGDDVAKVDLLFRGFAGALVGWNLEDDGGQPVPATVEGLYAQDLAFVLEIIAAWAEAIGGVSGPLEKRSPSGVTFPEASLPMERLSVSRAS